MVTIRANNQVLTNRRNHPIIKEDDAPEIDSFVQDNVDKLRSLMQWPMRIVEIQLIPEDYERDKNLFTKWQWWDRREIDVYMGIPVTIHPELECSQALIYSEGYSYPDMKPSSGVDPVMLDLSYMEGTEGKIS